VHYDGFYPLILHALTKSLVCVRDILF